MSGLRAADRAALAALAAVIVVAAPGSARANGAFPTAQAVLLPEDRPQETVLVTNFGLVISEDGGQTWSWTCEQDANALGMLYQLGPAPRRRLFTVANQQVVYSDDGGCSWQIAGGLLANQSVTDLYPDATNAERVLAIGIANTVYSVFASSDGGATFGSMIYQAAAGEAVNGVEIARSNPQAVYLALTGADHSPKLARSADGGAHFTVGDLTPSLGPGLLRIIAVDPTDANTVLLRWSAVGGGEALGMTRDGGATATKPLTIPNYFTAFARMPSGALVLGAMAFVGQGLVPALFVSHDGGASFEENSAVPNILALGQRGGVLYAAADNFGDGFALGASDDEGVTWRPVLRYDQIGSVLACVRSNPQCQASCEALAGQGPSSPGMIWEESVCTANPPTAGTAGTSGGTTGGSSAGGTSGSGASGSAGTGGSSGGAGSSGASRGSSASGCAVEPFGPAADLCGAALLAALIVATLVSRRRKWSARAVSSSASGSRRFGR